MAIEMKGTNCKLKAEASLDITLIERSDTFMGGKISFTASISSLLVVGMEAALSTGASYTVGASRTVAWAKLTRLPVISTSTAAQAIALTGNCVDSAVARAGTFASEVDAGVTSQEITAAYLGVSTARNAVDAQAFALSASEQRAVAATNHVLAKSAETAGHLATVTASTVSACTTYSDTVVSKMATVFAQTAISGQSTKANGLSSEG